MRFEIQSISRTAKKVIHTFENPAIPFSNYCLTFIAAVGIRNFLESYSQQDSNYFNLNAAMFSATMLHFFLFYITLALSFMVLFHYATRVEISKVARIILPAFIILLLPPVIDLCLSQGQGQNMRYFLPGVDLKRAFFTYSSNDSNITSGIKTEIVLVLLGAFFYFRTKNQGVLPSFFYTLVMYSVFFFSGMPVVILNTLFTRFGFQYHFSIESIINYYAILLVFLGLWTCYLANKKIFMAFLGDIRVTRILHYELMLLLGFTIGLTVASSSIDKQLHIYPELITDAILLSISLCFASVASIIFNNIADYEIDKISNPLRPHVIGSIPPRIYAMTGYITLIAALFYAYLVGAKALTVILFSIAVYYIYSMPPIRFKRILLFSKLAIAGNSLVLIILGYLCVQDDVILFPRVLFPIFLIGYAFASNFIDIKDISGDAAAGVKTLPVVLGDKVAKIIIGLAFIATYLAFYYFLQNKKLLPVLLVGGVIQFVLINKRRTQEGPIFSVYLMSILMLIGYLLYVKMHFD
jgi:4-hydroxybenzoate polyprenyltransferase